MGKTVGTNEPQSEVSARWSERSKNPRRDMVSRGTPLIRRKKHASVGIALDGIVLRSRRAYNCEERLAIVSDVLKSVMMAGYFYNHR
ncbi:MAG TPA: hypothetical protein PLL30_00450 [Candidatus Krumholzibacteria bacterium]|nr:hypothetical protein [Candidatus Krumholzibacteria bacterium]HRY40071.1 hypothetical protein [Candidatus Krumholzibacteria bacterium]